MEVDYKNTSYYVSTPTCFGTKVSSSGGLLKTRIISPTQLQVLVTSANLYVFDSDREAQVNKRCMLQAEIVATVQHLVHQIISFVKMFLRAGEYIRNHEVTNELLAIHESLGGGL